MEMIGEKCPLCDGPVSGGRCTLCGMPYRKDEILYHLNENSRDHYKHATDKARDIMRKNAGVSGDRAVGKNASEADIRKVAEASMHSYWDVEPFAVNPQMVYDGIMMANVLGMERKAAR